MATAADLLQRKGGDVFTVEPTDTVLEAARRMHKHRVGGLVVCDSAKRMVGIFTERDILGRVVAETRPPETTRVSDVMSTNVVYCSPDTPVNECRELMSRRRLRHLPVLDKGQLVGLISVGDIMAHEVAAQQVTIEYMHQYIHGRS